MWLPTSSSSCRPASLLSTVLATVVLLGSVSATQSPPVTEAQTPSVILSRAVSGDGDDFKIGAPTGRKCKRANIDFECLKDGVDFPTYDCIRKDMLACGIVGPNTIFYSFGAGTRDVTPFRDSKKGVMFNDAMGDEWWLPLERTTRFRLEYAPRQDVFIARFAQAMASVATGETFLAVPKDVIGDFGVGGAYTIPKEDGKLNVWRFFEFPQLQRNQLVTKVTLVDVTTKDNGGKQTFPQHVGWLPNDSKYPQLTFEKGESNDLPVPPAPGPPAPTCTQHFQILRGYIPAESRRCECSDGSKPKPKIVNGLYKCPNEIAIKPGRK